jgi:hypothetical protein
VIYLAPADENSAKMIRRSHKIEMEKKRRTGHRLGALRDGVLGQFTRKDETDGGLDFSR